MAKNKGKAARRANQARVAAERAAAAEAWKTKVAETTAAAIVAREESDRWWNSLSYDEYKAATKNFWLW